MGIQIGKVEVHWNYLLAIERDIEELARFIEFDDRNFDCFSVEIARVLMATCAEIDVVLKQLCVREDPKSKAATIDGYMKCIRKHLPTFETRRVLLPRFGLELDPWMNWRDPKTPYWWTAYNKTKHERHQLFEQANLQNALNAFCGLFVAVLYLYRDKALYGELNPNPTLLRPHQAYFVGVSMNTEHAFVYDMTLA